MEFKDYYQIMGVAEDATPEQIKHAYRKLARKYHPDVSKEANAEERFKELNEANEVLKDAEKRAAYDQLRHSSTSDTSNPSAADFSEFFQSIFGDFGGRQRAHRAMRGEDLSYICTIKLEEAYHGCHKTLQFPTRNIKVNIPKGISEGKKIRLKQQGGPGFNGGPNGDLYLEIHIQPHPVFMLKDKDIHLILPVAPWEAALGAKIKVPTLSGNVEMKLPSNSQSGQKLKLSQRGLPGSPPGDQIIQLQIVNPEMIEQNAKLLYEELAKTVQFNPRKGLGV